MAVRDELRRAHRILVAGTSGSGKTTLAREIAAATGIPHTELDSLAHGPGWTRRPEFPDEVRALAGSHTWITEWQYEDARALLLARAELLVWLDPPVAVVMTQVIRRTVARSLRRAELWNGNVEPPLRTILTDRDHIVRWAWRTRGAVERRLRAGLGEGTLPPVVRIRDHRDRAALLAHLGR